MNNSQLNASTNVTHIKAERANVLGQGGMSSGAIPSTVFRAGESHRDDNNFVTALWLRELRMRNLDQFAGLEPARSAALDFLESSVVEDEVYGRIFSFWPTSTKPSWAGDVGPDLDDTCIILNELIQAGRLSASSVKPSLYRLLAHMRVPSTHGGRPRWAKSGCYYTWIDESRRPINNARSVKNNIIDVCVNANVVALLAQLNAKTAPGYQSACQTILSALEWAHDRPARWKAVSPYYPNLTERMFAIEHAVSCGAHELLAARDLTRKMRLDVGGQDASLAVCSGAYGEPLWHCDAVQMLRHQSFDALGDWRSLDKVLS